MHAISRLSVSNSDDPGNIKIPFDCRLFEEHAKDDGVELEKSEKAGLFASSLLCCCWLANLQRGFKIPGVLEISE